MQKHIGALVDKGLIQTEETTIRRKNGFVYNGSLLYTLKPIQQVLKEHEKELLAELKLAKTQHRWTTKVNAITAMPADTNGKNYPAVISIGTPETVARPTQCARG